MSGTGQQITLGVMGGGQLGRMFVQAAQAMGYFTAVLDPDPASPAGLVAHFHIETAYDDEQGLAQLMQRCDAITTEFENVPAPALITLGAHRPVAPSASCVAVAQDRIQEKAHFVQCGPISGVYPAPYAAIDQQFKQLIALAKRQGSAIAIGHPYPETYAYLKKHLADLATQGIEVVKLSALLPADYSVMTAAQTADVPLTLPERDPVQLAHVNGIENTAMNTPVKTEIAEPVFVPAIEEPAAIIAMYSQQWDIPELLNPLTLAVIAPAPVLIQKPWALPEPAKKPVKSLPFYQLGSSF